MPAEKESFKKTLEEIEKLAERKLAPKLRKHEGPGRKKRLTAEETVSELGREWQEEQEKRRQDYDI